MLWKKACLTPVGTMVTSFPQRSEEKLKETDTDDSIDMTNVIDRVMEHIELKNREPLTSVYDLAELIVGQCLGLNQDAMEWEHERHRYLEIFDHSINMIVSRFFPVENNAKYNRPTKRQTASTNLQTMAGSTTCMVC